MAGLAAAIFLCVVTLLLLFGLSRRRQFSEHRAYIVIPYDGDINSLEAAVRAYYYEEMFESAEYRRAIIVSCHDGEKSEIAYISNKYPSIKIVNETQLVGTVFRD